MSFIAGMTAACSSKKLIKEAIRRFSVWVLSAVIVFQPIMADIGMAIAAEQQKGVQWAEVSDRNEYADDTMFGAAEGNDLWGEIKGGVAFPETNNGKSFKDPTTGDDIPVNQLFGAPSRSPDASAQGMYRMDKQEYSAFGKDEQKKLKLIDSKASDENYVPEGDAYRTLRETAYMAKPDLEKDPMWGSVDEVYNILDGGETNCTDPDTHEPDYRTCTRLNTGSESCNIYHDYDAGVMRYISGAANMENCGDGCFNVWLGDKKNNHLVGSCKIFEKFINIEMLNVDAIESAVIESAYYDDYIQIWLGDNLLWDGPYTGQGIFPPETSGRCELSTSWKQTNLNRDFTDIIKSYSDGDIMNFRIRVSVSGAGEGYANFKIKYDPDKIIKYDVWSDTGTADVQQKRVTIEEGNFNLKMASDAPQEVIFEYDLKNGTIRPVDSNYRRYNAQGAQLDYDKICGQADEEKVSTSFVMMSGGLWHGHGLGGLVDDTITTQVIQYPSCDNGLVGKVKIRDRKNEFEWDEWRLTGNLNFMYKADIVKYEGDIRGNCIAKAKRYEQTYGVQSWRCVKEPQTNAAGCAVINGTLVCPRHFKNPPIGGISPLCEVVHVVEPKGKIDGETSCKEFEDNPQCGYVTSTCKDKSNHELVVDLYEYGLGRTPSTSELGYWKSRLDSGVEYDVVIDEFFDAADLNGEDYIDKFSCMEFEEVWDCGYSEASNSGACAVKEDILPGEFADCSTELVEVEYEKTVRLGTVEACDEALKLTECTIDRDFVKTARAESTNWDRDCLIEETVSYRTPWHENALAASAQLNVSGVFTDARIIQQPSLANGWVTQVKLTGPGQMVTKTREVPRDCTADELAGLTELEKAQKVCTDTVTYETMECPAGTELNARLDLSGYSLEVFEKEFPEEEGNNPCLRDTDNFTETTWQCNEFVSNDFGDGIVVSDAILNAAVDVIAPDVPAACANATAIYETKEYGTGEYCSKNTEGEVICENLEGDTALSPGENSCQDLEAREATGECVYEGRYPVQDGSGSTGFQYVWEHRYNCAGPDEVKTVTKTRTETQYVCDGEIRCMGEECMTGVTDESQGFEKAVGMLNAITEMGSDVECSVTTNGSMSECKVFSGQALTCKVALGGYKSCCETPSGVSLGDYIKVMRESQKLANFTWESSFMEPVRGTYTSMKSSVVNATDWVANTDTYKAISETFTSVADNVTGAFAGGAGSATGGTGMGVISQASVAVEQAVYAFKQTLMRGAQAFLKLIDPTGTIANAIFTETVTNEAGKQVGTEVGLSQGMSAALSFIGMVYTIYVIADLLINLIYACDEEENQLNVDRKLKKTHYIGTFCRQKALGACIEKRRSFCAFSSPLARIVNEQARLQLDIGWGTPKVPDCTGITLEQLTYLDWSKIDLSEWIDILDITGNMPGMDGLDIDKVTGTGSFLNRAESPEDGVPARKNAADRNAERLEEADIWGTNQAAGQDMWSSQ